MRKIIFYPVLVLLLCVQSMNAQETETYKIKIEELKELKNQIAEQEKEALKLEVEAINKRLKSGDITLYDAKILKEKAARKRALNIENRLEIVDNRILLLERNKGNNLVLAEKDSLEKGVGFSINVNGEPVFSRRNNKKRVVKYDRRTYSDFVFALGLNNAIIKGESIEDTPYKVGGSKFFEFGWQWRTRVFKNTNFMRFNYGVSFQFNGLKPKNNQYFVLNNENETVLEEFNENLDKSKFRTSNLVFPIHLEFGSSHFKKSEETIRYHLKNKFRLGIGVYGGFNMGTRQKLKYSQNGERMKEIFKKEYNTSDFIYGLSAYGGFEGVLVYMKYDLNPIFKNADIQQNNISLGFRFDL